MSELQAHHCINDTRTVKLFLVQCECDIAGAKQTVIARTKSINQN